MCGYDVATERQWSGCYFDPAENVFFPLQVVRDCPYSMRCAERMLEV